MTAMESTKKISDIFLNVFIKAEAVISASVFPSPGKSSTFTKAALRQTSSKPIYEALDRLDEQIEMKTREVLKGAQAQFDERAKLFSQHDDLWQKIESVSNEEQKNAKKYVDYIRASKTLTSSEKEILLKAQTKIDELDAVIETFYAKAEAETADLRKQQEDELEKLNNLQEKTRSIWDKIYQQ